MVHVPKQIKTYCPHEKCKKHVPWKITQYKTGKASKLAQGTRRYQAKQKGFGGQTKPIFRKKAKLTKKTSLKMCCQICKIIRCKPIRRTRSFVLGKKEKSGGEHSYF